MIKQYSMFNRLVSCIKERRLPWRLHNLFHINSITPRSSIILEISSMCNVRCVWCIMYVFGKKDMGLMSFENFKKFIDLNAKYLINQNISVVPYHRGEPLIHPEFFEMLDYASRKGVSLGDIHTNLSIKELDVKRLMESLLSSITVNIGGVTQEVHQKVMRGSDLEIVKINLKEMIKLNKFNKPIFVKMNPTKNNVHQIKDLPYFFKELGGDSKKTQIGTTGFSLPDEASMEEREEFVKNIVSDDVEEYLRFTVDGNNIIAKTKKECLFLIPTIKWDGKVTVCCHDLFSRLNLGNAFETPLESILKSKKYRISEKTGSQRGFPFCKNCN